MADFQSGLQSVKEYLDWNKWMITGLVIWGLLVAVVQGAGNGPVSVQCQIDNELKTFSSSAVECTCKYPFPGYIWIVGLVIMAVVTTVEALTDWQDRKMKSVEHFWSHDAPEDPRGPFDLTKDVYVSNLRELARYKIENAAKLLTAQVGININDSNNNNFNGAQKKLEKNDEEEKITHAISIAMANLQNAPSSSPFVTPPNPATHITPEENFLVEVIVMQEMSRMGINVDSPVRNVTCQVLESWIANEKLPRPTKILDDLGITTVICRLLSNLLLFYTILAISSYTWFPEDKGCFIPWTNHAKNYSLLAIAISSIVVLVIRILCFDVSDKNPKSKAT